jgi:hypothetical protein
LKFHLIILIHFVEIASHLVALEALALGATGCAPSHAAVNWHSPPLQRTRYFTPDHLRMERGAQLFILKSVHCLPAICALGRLGCIRKIHKIYVNFMMSRTSRLSLSYPSQFHGISKFSLSLLSWTTLHQIPSTPNQLGEISGNQGNPHELRIIARNVSTNDFPLLDCR